MIQSYREFKPQLAPGVFVAPDADLIGDVTVGEGSSIWYHTVLRGDVSSITIGPRVNLQDGVVVHNMTGVPVVLHEDVTIGHNVLLHSCTVEKACLIGMGAILLDGSWIGEGSVVAAGTVIPPGKKIPPRSLVMGVPGKIVGTVDEDGYARNLALAESYCKLAQEYLALSKEQ